MPVTERVVDEVLTLPLHSLMKEAHVERVIDGVRSFFGSVIADAADRPVGRDGTSPRLAEFLGRLGYEIVALGRQRPRRVVVLAGRPGAARRGRAAGVARRLSRRAVRAGRGRRDRRGDERLALQETLAVDGLPRSRSSCTRAPSWRPTRRSAPGRRCSLWPRSAPRRARSGLHRQHGASVDHECRLDDGVHVGPGAALAGNVTRRPQRAFIGTGAAVVPHVDIGADAIVGAGRRRDPRRSRRKRSSTATRPASGGRVQPMTPALPFVRRRRWRSRSSTSGCRRRPTG